MTPAEATALSGATRPRFRDCPDDVRELRARERALCGLHRLDRTLHAFWERLPLRELRIAGTVAVLGVGVYLVVVRRGSIERSLSKVGSAQPGWIAVAVAAELMSLVCYAALVRVLLQLGAVTVPFRALFSLTVIGIAMLNSIPGGQAISTIYWYEQLRRYAVQRSVAVFALLVSSLLGIATLVLLAACGLAVGSHGFAAQARFPVLAVAAAILIAAILGRRQFVPAALWAVRHLGGRDVAAEQPVAANHLVLLLVLGFLNWLFDAAVLFAALAAMGQTIPVRGVVVAYTLGQLVSAIPILPGGGGTIEATMSAGLILAGGTGAAVIAAVLLYRIVSAWALVPLGWGLWRTMPNAHTHLAQLEPAAGPA
jgi:putative heme transporter